MMQKNSTVTGPRLGELACFNIVVFLTSKLMIGAVWPLQDQKKFYIIHKLNYRGVEQSGSSSGS